MIAKLSVALFSFILLYFAYLGVTTTPAQLGEVDSLTYHIPIAQSFARGEFLNLSHIPQGLGYYPAVGEIILSLFIKLGIPLNLFNVLGLVLLFLSSGCVARVFGLRKKTSLVFATAISLLPSFLRLIPTQTIDIWLTVFFLWCLYLLQKPQRKISYFLKLGFSFGLLTGVKYSGILLSIALLIIYFKKLFPTLSLKRSLAFFVSFAVFGLLWYGRNWIVAGNPFYPVGILFWHAHPDFHATDWTSLKVISTPGGISLMLQALVSEFLLWSITPLLVILVFIYSRLKKQVVLFKNLTPLILLGFANFLIFLPQPSWPNMQITFSNMRLVYPSIVPFMLIIFLIAKRAKVLEKLKLIAFLNAVAVLSQIAYRPKLVVLWLVFFLILLFKSE